MASDDRPPNALRRDLLQVALAVSAAAGAPISLGGLNHVASSKFSVREHDTLLAVGETLVPGADLSRFVSGMLTRDVSMLSYPFVSLPLDVRVFYHEALLAIDSACRRTRDRGFVQLSSAERTAVMQELMAGQLKGWDGPPPGLVYFVLRSDATDAVYGRPQAYDDLQVPYMAHIQPPPFA
jgi:Gluconate 2-dehydrogenase subunit 3